MKCEKCDRQATFHITEMIDAVPKELHLCEVHASEYLHVEFNTPPNLFVDKSEFDLKEAADELLMDDFQICPCCGTSFQDFRKSGFLGCVACCSTFREQLEPFLFTIHGSSKHEGKRPLRLPGADRGAKLVRLRSALADAIEIEDYENASKIRDQIAALEKSV